MQRHGGRGRNRDRQEVWVRSELATCELHMNSAQWQEDVEVEAAVTLQGPDGV